MVICFGNPSGLEMILRGFASSALRALYSRMFSHLAGEPRFYLGVAPVDFHRRGAI